ncbi:hypothetical protein BJV78DRAFT_1278723 [Lactifluus subvellereus]|nr:hypothetical protein BJV78DRAFT_1278723 [Lactifluus subvellereus]
MASLLAVCGGLTTNNLLFKAGHVSTFIRTLHSQFLDRSVHALVMTRRIRQAAYKLFTKEPDSNTKGFQGVVEGSIHDQWGIAPHYFPTISPPHEKVVKGGDLKQMRSMPFFSTSSQPSAATRHIRKNSKVAQVLGPGGASEEAKDSANVAHPTPNYGGTASHLVLPMNFDPSYGSPLGAVTVGNGLSASQVQGSRPAAQQVHRPALSMPSVSVPAECRPTHAHTRHTNASQSTNGFSRDTAAERAPRSQLRVDRAKADTLSARSRSHPPPPASTLGVQTTSYSQPPLNPSVVNLESTGQHGSTSTHARYPVDAFDPRVRSTTATTHKRYQDAYDPAPKQVPHLRKARSSVILSNVPPPLYAPKPLNHLERPCAETLHALVESSSRKPSHSNVQSVVATANALWPPPPVVPPLRGVMPPRAEQDPHRAAAIEADKAYRKIGRDRALVERIRDDHGREVRRAEQDSERQRPRHHRRAATENFRRHA